jgi:hypothetical protein
MFDYYRSSEDDDIFPFMGNVHGVAPRSPRLQRRQQPRGISQSVSRSRPSRGIPPLPPPPSRSPSRLRSASPSFPRRRRTQRGSFSPLSRTPPPREPSRSVARSEDFLNPQHEDYLPTPPRQFRRYPTPPQRPRRMAEGNPYALRKPPIHLTLYPPQRQQQPVQRQQHRGEISVRPRSQYAFEILDRERERKLLREKEERQKRQERQRQRLIRQFRQRRAENYSREPET